MFQCEYLILDIWSQIWWTPVLHIMYTSFNPSASDSQVQKNQDNKIIREKLL